MSTLLRARFSLAVALVALLATGVVACGDDDLTENQNQNQTDPDGSDSIAVAGAWENQFETVEVIDDEKWDFMTLLDFDNEERWAITQNADDDEWNPSAFNRVVWTPIENDVFYYCTAVFAAETETEAREEEGDADPENLESGCGENGFAWNQMTRQ